MSQNTRIARKASCTGLKILSVQIDTSTASETEQTGRYGQERISEKREN